MRRIALLLVAVVLLAGGMMLLRSRQEKEVRRERGQARLLPFDARRVTGLTLTTEGTDWVFRKEDSGWRLISPVSDAAGDEAISRLLVTLGRTPVVRTIDTPDALANYGLEPAVARIRLGGVTAPALDVGDLTPTKDAIFARVEGRRGILVLERTEGLDLVAPAPGRLRDPSLTGLLRADLSEIGLEEKGSRILLKREADGWWIESPRRLPASEAAVARLLETLDKARIRSFDDDPAAREALLSGGEASVAISLRGSTGARTITIGPAGEDGLRRATRDDRKTVLLVDGAKDLTLSVEELSSEKLTKLNRYQVVRFAYRKGGRELSARREGPDRWVSATGQPIPTDRVLALLVRVVEAPVRGWQAASAAGGEEAALDYEMEGGASGRLMFERGGRARLSTAPQAAALLAGPAPDVP